MARPFGGRRRSEATALPGRIKLQLTKLVDQAPDGPDWLHEIKFDGYGMHARLDGGAAGSERLRGQAPQDGCGS
jgi:ATP-dependent DNA ligase